MRRLQSAACAVLVVAVLQAAAGCGAADRETESYPVVVQDGSLYFSSQRPGGLGGYDIYRSRLLQEGGFEEPESLGPPIKTEFHLFFFRRTGASWDEAPEGEIFWVDISVIERLRP